MIKTITITIDMGNIHSSIVVDKIEDAIWDQLHDLGGQAILEDGEPCGKMDLFGMEVEVKST